MEIIIKKNFNKHLIDFTAPVKNALLQFEQGRLRFLLCIDQQGLLKGVLTPGDINRWLIAEGNNSLNVSVRDISNLEPTAVYEGADVSQIKRLLRTVSFVPVLDKKGRLTALATRRSEEDCVFIGGREVGPGRPCFVIAEIGNNHNGDLGLAKRLIDHAHKSGADCVKFQMRDLNTLYSNAGNNLDPQQSLGTQYTLDILRKFQLNPEQLFEAFDYCISLGLIPLCTPWDEVSASRLEEYGLSAYKVASADLTNQKLLKLLSSTGKTLICSTGMSREDEIIEAVGLLQNLGATFALLHCNSTYPTPFKDINLNYISRLKEIGRCVVGYSGHERDIFVSVAAVAKGANIIERHLTLNRSMEGNDHKISLLPDEFSRLVEGVRQIETALGDAHFRELSQGEMMNRVTLAKSVFINCDLRVGEKFSTEMLQVMSPGHGLQPNRLQDLIGMPAKRKLRAGDILFPSDLEDGPREPRPYKFHSKWGLPVRHHDYKKLSENTNPTLLELHLSYRDLELDHSVFFPEQLGVGLVVHAPELFEHDHTLDLTSLSSKYRQKSIDEMRRVIELAKLLGKRFSSTSTPVKIVTNVGGFSQDAPLSASEILTRLNILRESLAELNDPEVEILPQTMPPFPWHFGGQRFHNLFVEPNQIRAFCEELGIRVCLDVSHSKLACNKLGIYFQAFLQEVLPTTAHLHIADSLHLDGEGLQIGEGEIDFLALGMARRRLAPDSSWIIEVWQGHENNGEGFWMGLERLEQLQVF